MLTRLDRPSDQYVLHTPSGKWLYHLPTPSGFYSDQRTGVLADDQPMTPLPQQPRSAGSWWVSDHQATTVTAVYSASPKTLRYDLTEEDALSSKYPASLTAEEYQERRGNDDDDNLWRFYTAITEPMPDRVYTYEGPFVVLAGDQPPGRDDLPWVAELPHTLTQRPEYLHCFPGYIPGLREHVQQIADRMRHVKYCHNNHRDYGAGLRITIAVPFVTPATRWVPRFGNTGRQLKAKREVPDLVERTFFLPVPDHVPGDSYADARTKWDHAVEELTGIIAAANVRACDECGGKGHVGDNSPSAPDAPTTENYPGELAMLRGLLGVLRATADHRPDDGMPEIRRLLDEHQRDEHAAYDARA